MTTSHSDLNSASDDIKLAVDLIYLLETNDIDPNVALSAINMVKSDLERKINVAEKDQCQSGK